MTPLTRALLARIEALDVIAPLARHAVVRLHEADMGSDRTTALANSLAKLDATGGKGEV